MFHPHSAIKRDQELFTAIAGAENHVARRRADQMPAAQEFGAKRRAQTRGDFG